MGRVCYLCGYNSKRKHPNAENTSRPMHRLPKRKEIRAQWLKVCGLTEEMADEYSAIYICSSHFTPEDYIELNSKQKTLKPGTKPSLNLSPDNLNRDSGHVKLREGPACSTPPESIKTSSVLIVKVEETDTKPINTPPPSLEITSADISDVSCNERLTVDDNHCTESPEYTGTPQKRKFFEPRYVNEITISDMATPKRAKRVLQLVQSTNERKNKLIKQLRAKNRYLQEKINTLNDLLKHLKEET